MTGEPITLCAKGCGRRATRRQLCHSHYEQHRTRQKAYGRWEVVYVDAEPARMHIKELQAAGLGLRRIAELAGVNRKTLQWITTGRSERGSGPSFQVHRDNAAKVLAVEVPDTAHESAADHQLVPAIGTVRRLQALVANGHPRSALAALLGIAPGNATRLFDAATERITAATARKVDGLFNELETTPGHSSRARNEGARNGWPLPLEWDADTLDDPAAEAPQPVPVKVGFDVLYRELRDLGYSDSDIARREGIQPDSLYQRLRRLGINAGDMRAHPR